MNDIDIDAIRQRWANAPVPAELVAQKDIFDLLNKLERERRAADAESDSLTFQLQATEHQRLKDNKMFLSAMFAYCKMTMYCSLCWCDLRIKDHSEHCPMATYGKQSDPS